VDGSTLRVGGHPPRKKEKGLRPEEKKRCAKGSMTLRQVPLVDCFKQKLMYGKDFNTKKLNKIKIYNKSNLY